jgi:hypothetical protein
MGEVRNAYRIIVVNLGRKRPFEKRRGKCEDNTKMDLKETEHKSMECIMCFSILVNTAGCVG